MDEAYAIQAAREFSWSFYDHPPLSFWAPVASAAVLGEGLLAYRLPSLLAGLGTGLLLWDIGRRLAGPWAGFWAVMLWSLAPHMLLASGLFVLPDATLNFGGALAAWALVRLVSDDRDLRVWALGGLGLAIALASKYQAGLIPAAVLSFMVVTGRWRWFARPGFWLAAAIAAVGVAPVLLWNASNDWISLSFQSGRAGGGLQPGNLAAMIGGQLAYLTPGIALLLVVAAIKGLRGAPERQVLAHLALWPILAFNAIFLFSNESLPHWTLPGFLFAIPLGAVVLVEAATGRWHRAVVVLALPVWALVLALLVHVPTGILSAQSPEPPEWDRTESVFDWSGLAPELIEAGAWAPGTILATRSWIDAGQLGTGMAQGLGAPVPARTLTESANHLQFHEGAAQGGPAVYLVPGRVDTLDAEAALAQAQDVDSSAELVGTVVLPRGGKPYAGVIVVRMTLPPQ